MRQILVDQKELKKRKTKNASRYRRRPYVFKKIMEIGLISIQVLYLSKHASFLHCFSRISLNWPYLRDVKGSIEAGRCDFYARVATFWFI